MKSLLLQQKGQVRLFVPSLPSMQKCVRALQYSAKSWQHTKCIKFYNSFHYSNGNTPQAVQVQKMFGFCAVF